MEEAQVGIIIGNGKKCQFNNKSIATFQQPVFTESDFMSAMRGLINDQTYEVKMQRLRCIARVAGGTSKAVTAIEEAFLHYSISHL